MVSNNETLRLFNSEKDYEEQIASDILGFLDFSLNDIEDMNDDEKDAVREIFSTIRKESIRHKERFEELIKYCLENGKNNY